MELYWPVFETTASWAPLERIVSVASDMRRVPRLRAVDFLYLTRLQAPGRPTLHVYKHRWTRRSLNVDNAGHAYRFGGAARGDCGEVGGWYEQHRDLLAAIAHLGLMPPVEQTCRTTPPPPIPVALPYEPIARRSSPPTSRARPRPTLRNP